MITQTEAHMKKFLQVSVVILIVLTLLATVLTFTRAGTVLASGDSCTRVGWNTRSPGCFSLSPALHHQRGLAYQYVPDGMQFVGWNT
jgi:hypothetical protein